MVLLLGESFIRGSTIIIIYLHREFQSAVKLHEVGQVVVRQLQVKVVSTFLSIPPQVVGGHQMQITQLLQTHQIHLHNNY